MSQWTHINAMVRFDGIPEMKEPITKEELGVVSTWEEGEETNIPCGSEGSLDYEIIDTARGESGYAACRAVAFWGDLRDYDSADEILEYFTKIIQGKMIRSGVLEINIEMQRTLVYRVSDYDENTPKTWECIVNRPQKKLAELIKENKGG